jgi:hypothetical protein
MKDQSQTLTQYIASPVPESDHSPHPRSRVVLVSCVSRKLTHPAPAADLYQSAWFKKARRYAELHAERWYILSAKHGLLIPDQVIEPYDLSLYPLDGRQRQRWAREVLALLLQVTDKRQDKITVLAGSLYRAPLVRWLKNIGYTVHVPMEGLGIGQQLRWLNEQNQVTQE